MIQQIKVRDLQRGSTKEFSKRLDVKDSKGHIIGKLFPPHYQESSGFTEEDRANLLHVVEMVDKIWSHLQSLSS